jgi:hypothetical protein
MSPLFVKSEIYCNRRVSKNRMWHFDVVVKQCKYCWQCLFIFGEPLLSYNVIGGKKAHFKHPYLLCEAYHRKLWQLHQKIGNFILFKPLLEPTVFDIAIKIYNENMESPPRLPCKHIVVPWKIPIQQPNCKLCSIYLHLNGKKGINVPHPIFWNLSIM